MIWICCLCSWVYGFEWRWQESDKVCSFSSVSVPPFLHSIIPSFLVRVRVEERESYMETPLRTHPVQPLLALVTKMKILFSRTPVIYLEFSGLDRICLPEIRDVAAAKPTPRPLRTSPPRRLGCERPDICNRASVCHSITSRKTGIWCLLQEKMNPLSTLTKNGRYCDYTWMHIDWDARVGDEGLSICCHSS